MVDNKNKIDETIWAKIDKIISFLFRTGQTNLATDAVTIRQNIVVLLEGIQDLSKNAYVPQVVCRRVDCKHITDENTTRGTCGLNEIDITAKGCIEYQKKQEA